MAFPDIIRRNLAWIGIASLLVMPALVLSSLYDSYPVFNPVLSLLIFCFPIVVFYRNIRVYLYALTFIIVLTPFFLFSIVVFRLTPGIELFAVILQTNLREAREAAGPYLWYFVPVAMVYIGSYLTCVSFVRVRAIKFSVAAIISITSVGVVYSYIYLEKQLYYKSPAQLRPGEFIDTYHYPLSLVAALNEVRIHYKKTNLDRAKHFSFGAKKTFSDIRRQVHVLIIGESARYDHWGINGYPRPTSPHLAVRRNLISFSDVIAAGHYTWVSVPQIITRATPDDYDRQYREKSILVAFQEAGFHTAWLSNQTDQDLFWNGSIALHAKTAAFFCFSPSYSPNFEFENYHDERLLSLADSLVENHHGDLFLVLHTMGSHWDYSKRYPQDFDRFQPSGYTVDINPPDVSNKEAIINSYDNSILYADFMIDNVIRIVEKHDLIATVTYVSDHGDDLFDGDPENIDFHLTPSRATLHVPLFFWASDEFIGCFSAKYDQMVLNRDKPVASQNVFHTLLDIACISTPFHETTRSLASRDFIPPDQKFYGDDKRAIRFSSVQH